MAERLIVGAGRGDDELLRGGIEYTLLNEVGAVGQAGKRDCEGDDVFGIIQVGVHVQRADFMGLGVEGDGHLVARQGVVREDDVRGSGAWGGINRNFAGLDGLLNLIGIRWDVEGKERLDLSHVILHLSGLLFDDSLLESAAAGWRWRRAHWSLDDFSVRAVLATGLRWRLV